MVKRVNARVSTKEPSWDDLAIDMDAERLYHEVLVLVCEAMDEGEIDLDRIGACLDALDEKDPSMRKKTTISALDFLHAEYNNQQFQYERKIKRLEARCKIVAAASVVFSAGVLAGRLRK